MIKMLVNYLGFAAGVILGSGTHVFAGTVTFGVGANSFQIDFVDIGSAGNAPDTDPNAQPISNTLGSVSYEYSIAKYEVSEVMITKFNASQSLQITTNNRGENKPATSVSWNEAARFVNWLNTSNGGYAAYKFRTSGVNDDISPWRESDRFDFDPLNPFRSKRATFVLPSYNEWYKAAYYDPINETYYDYATGSDDVPTAVASGTDQNTAVYEQLFEVGPADVMQAGGLSPFGVMGLGGNVSELEETSFDLTNSDGSSSRGHRGFDWYGNAYDMSSSTRNLLDVPENRSIDLGFRVVRVTPSTVTVPEPTSLLIYAFGFFSTILRPTRKSRL